jgi:RNA polymerase sigma-70 factor (ECF subfamily)
MDSSGRGAAWAGHTSHLIEAARGGSAEALGRLLEACRAYLLLVANEDLSPDLQPKGGASDLVQDTFLEAYNDFPRFQGHTHQELLNWLRGILRHNLADFRRRYRNRAVRQVSQERPLQGGAVAGLREKLVAANPSPEERAVAAEEAEAVRRAVSRLPADYHRVIMLRHEQSRSFDDIAREMGRTVEAARKLWFRAVEHLRQDMKALHEPD